MTDVSGYFAIRAISVDSTTWTPITTPIGCNTWSVRPDDPVKIRTDSANAATEDTILQGVQDVFQVPGSTGARFPAGTTFAYLQAVSGSTTVHVQFAR